MTKKKEYPIKHWSYSSLVSYLRNPLSWYKRYIEHVYDDPSSPASVIGRAGHYALELFYTGTSKENAIQRGLEYLQDVPDFEISFGVARSARAQKKKRQQMEQEYLRAIGFYLKRAPRHKVLGAEVKALARIPGVPIPVKAVSDLVVESQVEEGAVDIVDHKFVASFNKYGKDNPLFAIQALFNYYTVLHEYKRPVRRFIICECKKSKNKDGKAQLRKHIIDYKEYEDEMRLFQRLVADATEDLLYRKKFLPNPTDMFDGKNALEIYRWGL